MKEIITIALLSGLLLAIVIKIYKTGRKNAGYHPARQAEVYRNKLFHELAKRG